MRIGDVFMFAPPAHWQEFREGARFVYEGPSSEVLIVSATILQGDGSDQDRACVLGELLDNAKTAVTSAAGIPELREISPLQRSPEFKEVELWQHHSVTLNDEILFSQAIAVAHRGVMLLTLESPSAAGRHHEDFGSVLSSIHALTASLEGGRVDA
jgi:hypothetical protein